MFWMKVFIFVDQSVKFNLMSASSLINSHFIINIDPLLVRHWWKTVGRARRQRRRLSRSQPRIGRSNLGCERMDVSAPLFWPPPPKSKALASPSGPFQNQTHLLRTTDIWAGREFSLWSSISVGCSSPNVSATLEKATPLTLVVEPLAVVWFCAPFVFLSIEKGKHLFWQSCHPPSSLVAVIKPNPWRS